jgi:hypothetical protein
MVDTVGIDGTDSPATMDHGENSIPIAWDHDLHDLSNVSESDAVVDSRS